MKRLSNIMWVLAAAGMLFVLALWTLVVDAFGGPFVRDSEE